MRPASLALALALASSCLTAASAMQDAAVPAARSAPADLLTDLRDDGSLVAGLDDPAAQVRWVAARGLARLAEAEQIPALAARLAHEGDEDVLAELIFALGQRGKLDAAAAGPALVALLQHGSAAIRAAAVASLGRLFDDRYAAEIAGALGDENPGVRGAAALALFRLDGRRYDHPRTVEPGFAVGTLANASASDPDPEVRWRATYALAGLRGTAELARLLPLSLTTANTAEGRIFAMRGLRALEKDGLLDLKPSPCLDQITEVLRADDERLVIEAVRALAQSGSSERIAGLLEHPSALVRLSAAESLRERLQQPDCDDETRAKWCESLQRAATDDASPMVRREVAALIVALAPPDHALFDLYWLAGSDDARDRERAAKELAARVPSLDAAALLERLLRDQPAVAAAALAAPGAPEVRRARLVAALAGSDQALVATAADESMRSAPSGSSPTAAAKPAPSTDPILVAALRAAHDRATGPEMKEARAMLRKALGLAPDTEPPARPAAADGAAPAPLLERLLAEHRDALADPSPRVELLTSRGRIELQLDRVNAPRHVASFLELAAAGFYDGLDFHRVVPNFVVQGLDPRGDGYGTGGRRLPDEFSPRPYDAGTVGMPNAGEPHTGGCQLFITHIPTPHLDGNYTVLGQVTAGMDVVQRLEIGDTVRSVRRIDS